MKTITNPDLSRLRLPLLLFPLLLILYNTVYLIAFVPYPDNTIVATWTPDNVYKIVFVLEEEKQLQVGDIILTVDGHSAQQSAWHPLYSSHHLPYTTLTVARGTQQITVTIPNIKPGILHVSNRLKTTGIALLTWLIAAPILLFATAQNRQAWRVGIFFSLLAVSISATEARIINVPGALPLAALSPPLAVAFAELPLRTSHITPPKLIRYLFRFFYLLAGGLVLLGLYEVFWLFPQKTSIEILTGFSLYGISSLFMGIGMLINPLILGFLAATLSNSYQRRQVLIILSFTGLAVLPLAFLSLIPLALTGNSLLPPWLAFLLLGLIPVGYGFAIYRRQYLNLEIFITNTLTILTLGLFMLSLYLVAAYLLSRYVDHHVFNPLYNLIPFMITLGIVPIAGRPTHRTMHMIVYGSQVTYQGYLARFAADLSANPQHQTLGKVMITVAELIQVRQAILLLVNDQQQLVNIACSRAAPLPPIHLKTDHGLNDEPVQAAAWSHITTNAPPLPDWVMLLVPMTVQNNLVGLLLFSLPLPDGYFNAAQVTFVRQAAATMGVASEVVRLFESSRQMSRKLLQIQDAERAALASQIHDEPLQQISLVTTTLERLMQQTDKTDLGDSLRSEKEALQQVVRQLRDICAGLRPPVLYQGVEWLIRDIAYTFQNNTQLDVHLDLHIPDTLVCTENTSIAIYHILLESLNNVRKHAAATAVWITTDCQATELTLHIADNGQGSSIKTLSLAELVRRQHFGIVGMYEWANMAGGDLSFSQRDGGGTAVSLQLPI